MFNQQLQFCSVDNRTSRVCTSVCVGLKSSRNWCGHLASKTVNRADEPGRDDNSAQARPSIFSSSGRIVAIVIVVVLVVKSGRHMHATVYGLRHDLGSFFLFLFFLRKCRERTRMIVAWRALLDLVGSARERVERNWGTQIDREKVEEGYGGEWGGRRRCDWY